MPRNSTCAACKLQRRKCTPQCIFAPYFPAEQPWKFANVHQVFGASNVGKLLRDLSPEMREDAVVSLVFEAEARLMDPVQGCVGHIFYLQHRLRGLALNLADAEKELAASDPLMPPQHHALPCQIQIPWASPSGMGIGEQFQMQQVFDGMNGGGGVGTPAVGTPAVDAAGVPAQISSCMTEMPDFQWEFEQELQQLLQLQQSGQCAAQSRMMTSNGGTSGIN